ncbi:MAG: VOC family protein [Stackebrandtia sp.]
MSIGIQVTFDAADPEKLSEFWAIALDYQLEPPPPGFADWREFASSIGLPEERLHDYSALVDPERAKPRLFFQRVPDRTCR